MIAFEEVRDAVCPSRSRCEVRNTFLTFSHDCIEMDDEFVVVPKRRALSAPPRSSVFQSAVDDRSSKFADGSSGKHDEVEPGAVSKKSKKCKKHKVPESWIYWWRAEPGTCPLSEFPINLLPFPPFKLWLSRENADGYVLIDGQFLVYQVLSSWNFKVLGIKLSDADISGLDSYIRRCKLGRLRIGDAVKLKKAKTPEALHELSSMRQLARWRLAQVKEIKRLRLARIENDVTAPEKAQQLQHPNDNNEASCDIVLNSPIKRNAPSIVGLASQTQVKSQFEVHFHGNSSSAYAHPVPSPEQTQMYTGLMPVQIMLQGRLS